MDKKEAIGFLRQSLGEIPKLARLSHDTYEYSLWRNNVGDILEEVFGKNSTEYERFTDAFSRSLYGDSQQIYVEELKMRETAILSIIQKYQILGIEEKPINKTSSEDNAEPPLSLYDAMHFHTKVVKASRELFKDGHYRDAIYRAFVEVNNSVKAKSGKSGLDGKPLMSTVFSPNNPIIKLNSLITQTDKDEQEGFMYLYMGAMQGIRNPKAHENLVQNNPYIALKLLGFASLLIETISFWRVGDAKK